LDITIILIRTFKYMGSILSLLLEQFF